jgi:hypothetical protein
MVKTSGAPAVKPKPLDDPAPNEPIIGIFL